MKKPLKIITNMSELGAGTRGASLGFEALKMASYKLKKTTFSDDSIISTGVDNSNLREKVIHPFAKRIDRIEANCRKSSEVIGNEISTGHLPFVISGDHSNAISTIAAIKNQYPAMSLGVIWVDAHADLHSPYTTPSGNVHGMPLAACLGEDNQENGINNLVNGEDRYWESLKNLGGEQPMIQAENIMFFAVRDTEEPEDNLMEKKGIRNFTVEELRHKGLNACLEEADKNLEHLDLIYVSFDVDSMDCNLVSKGTGTPVENGLSPEEAQEILIHFINDERLVALEMVEINPLLDDKGNVMAETSLQIFDKLKRTYQA